ncbi:hypothetical protein Celaphus_00002184 [Cervus elaphus hippelaphus]|uniref:Uncharacterized protein n=1 Tax=Cervus elaphus hippelaphus TaxID=46360 RepID=A0A212CG39_CEREH|nr:hypothetical protein Celaphus_00002184 [Cervus elaphus hippelaphus]
MKEDERAQFKEQQTLHNSQPQEENYGDRGHRPPPPLYLFNTSADSVMEQGQVLEEMSGLLGVQNGGGGSSLKNGNLYAFSQG